MVPLVIGGILLLPTELLAAGMALVISVGLWEWSKMVPLHTCTARTAFLVIGLALAGLIWLISPAAVILALLLAAFLWWLWVLFWLTHFEITTQPSIHVTALKLAGGYLVMLPAWTALIVLHGRAEDGPLITLFLLVVVWLADSGAYFAGQRWGSRKLAPVISPGKTWEGVYGAMVTSGIFALVAGLLYSHSLPWTAGLVMVTMVTVMFSIAGDLLESLMKRQCGIKDSGNIIPGHGGILDRIDSLTAAAPVFLLGLHWMQL
ncbi:MAG: phosphatidate cytidylyltransferase [Gammaproteobacteria bacterium]|nr:MAG: phosphatidate cytidylyltransferase [Gammaproteobacteria bacterium]